MTTIDDDFKAVVRSRDLVAIKLAVIGFIDTDKYMADFQFRSAAEYAHKRMTGQGDKGLFEQDDGNWVLSAERREWTEALWEALKVELLYNFSLEKLDDMERLMRHLRLTGAPRFQVEDNAFTQYRNQSKTHKCQAANRVLPICLAVGVIAGGVIGAAVKAKLAGAILGCVAGAGVYCYLKRKADK